MVHAGHLTLNEANLAPSAEWSYETSGWCFLQVSKGAGYVLSRPTSLSLAEGDVVLFYATAGARFLASQISDCKLHFFYLCPELLGGVFTILEQHYLEITPLEKPTKMGHFPAAERLAQEFSIICAAIHSTPILVLRCQLLLLAVTALTSEFAPAKSEIIIQSHNNDARTRFEQLIESLPATEIQRRSLSELAEMCRCSERHFRRLFRSRFGLSIRSKQMDIRLQRAQQLLSESNLKISQVAYESGFRHLGLFNARFKKRFGVTPSEWRQQASEKKTTKEIYKLIA